MFPGDRRRGGMNNRGGFPEFPEFPGFPELPGFPGFPTIGMGGSPFGSIFGGRDPFADPFFQNPMPMPMPMPMHMPMPGFGHNLISPFDDSDDDEEENYAHPGASFIHQRASNPPLPQQGVRRGPVIEELPDDEETPVTGNRPNTREPIIEHPDDEGHGDRGERNSVQQYEASGNQRNQASQNQNKFTSRSFTFSSSTVSGPGGVQYSTTSKRRMEPNGVIEEEFHQKDGSTGIESKRVARAVGDRMRAVSRKRNADGTENTVETLRNLDPEEAVKFEEDWERHAGSASASSLNRPKLLEGNSTDLTKSPQSRLPSAEGDRKYRRG